MLSSPLNGDGFGIAWYNNTLTKEPGLFKSTQPAWNNYNLNNIAKVIQSDLFLCHVRAASETLTISRENCHPFEENEITFMHNGELSPFSKLKRKLHNELSEKRFLSLQGSTDSEVIFSLFLDALDEKKDIVESLAYTINYIGVLTRKNGGYTNMNIIISNGEKFIASRYSSADKEPPSLFFKTFDHIEHDDNIDFKLVKCNSNKSIIVASEPLRSCSTWETIPENTIFIANKKGNHEMIDSLLR